MPRCAPPRTAAAAAILAVWFRRPSGPSINTLGSLDGPFPTCDSLATVPTETWGTALTRTRSILNSPLSGLGEPGRRCSLGEFRRGSSLSRVDVESEPFEIFADERAAVATEELLGNYIERTVRLGRFNHVQADRPSDEIRDLQTR